ncbi:MAG: helix-turn-helix domain-containing protein [Dehalococcoidia bacterium]|nr:helix-turn-helix domain-containing protein [Dehalococcoidia bacterium]
MLAERRGGSRTARTTDDPEQRHTNGRKVRADALPEHLDYRDGGCDLAPSCLRCPLERCRYDAPGGARRLLQAPRDDALRRRREEGIAIDALAAEFSVSRRSVFRILARGRARNGRAA